MWFPISSYEKPLTHYQILFLPVPINSTSSHAFQLLDMPDSLALSNHPDQFAIINQKQLSKWKTHSAIVCGFYIPLISTTIPNCITALFFNNKKQIINVCNFRFIPNLSELNLIVLTPTSPFFAQCLNINVDFPNYQYRADNWESDNHLLLSWKWFMII